MSLINTYNINLTLQQKTEFVVEAAKEKEYGRIAYAILHCFNQYRASLQEIESALRRSKCSVFLVSLSSPPHETVKTKNRNNFPYCLTVYIGEKNEAITFMRKEFSSTASDDEIYKENFNRLNDTGFLFRNEKDATIDLAGSISPSSQEKCCSIM